MEYKRVWAEIDLDAIGRNTAFIRACAPRPTKLLATVKANAYGHGAIEIAKTVLYHGADYLGVAICEEGVSLREHNIYAPVLILGYSPMPLLEQVLQYNLTQTIFSLETAAALSQIAARLGKRARVHIKVDTGMSRLGFLPNQKSLEQIAAITRMPGLVTEGVYTHFAQSDADNIDYTIEQLTKFQAFLSAMRDYGIHIPICHAANSAALLTDERTHLDMVRAGIVLYGLAPSCAPRFEALPLSPAMSLKTQISQIKVLEAGVSIGYGRTFTTQRETRVATIPVGYADGYSRRMAKGGRMLVGGQFANVVGAVCMDQLMIDISDIPCVKAGDEVVLMGRQGAHEITADEIARIQDTIHYEVVCGIGKRVPRVFWKNNQALKTEEYF